MGAGEHPEAGYDVHTDILALDDIEVVCNMDELPFRSGSFSALRANHILEHQSWELVGATMQEWARVLQPDSAVDVGVPDARCRAASWISGEISTAEANYWILGGHSDRRAHRGTDARGAPLWIWNAHHTLFDPETLGDLLARSRLIDIRVEPEDVCNLRAYARTAP